MVLVRHISIMKDSEKSEQFAGVRETIIQQSDEAALARFGGWNGLAAFTIEGTEGVRPWCGLAGDPQLEFRAV